MFVVMGATGHIGSELTKNLLRSGRDVTVITRSKKRAENLVNLGARLAEIDIFDYHLLHEVLKQASGVYILNPPANPVYDVDVEERKTIAAITHALENTNLEKVIVQSTYGAQEGDHIGDLGSLYLLEKKVKEIYQEAMIVRAAFYMSNWDFALNDIVEKGCLTTIYPSHSIIPMVAPRDIADYLTGLVEYGKAGIHYVEGPQRYTVQDVASAFQTALGKPVKLVEVKREDIENYYLSLTFSKSSAMSFAAMAFKTISGDWPPLNKIERGKITLQQYIEKLCLKVVPVK
ncbi:NmrA family NAD(P)-binding protein [Bartonella sp. M0177]|uniref:NmrA family NAD(P)-binding protein n=1 Tax=Bartonella sp. M0177 TaxID=2750940 RepID=UPI0018DE77FA|nr:NmrA family NAD(P)-binding protein [Bartonella sp. M0177]MBI0004515.1 NmrA family NAD(P)-binding protein [Bartonella sp. M0177]